MIMILIDIKEDELKLQERIAEKCKNLLDEQERLEFESGLQEVLSETFRNLFHLRLQEGYKLLEDFLRGWVNRFWAKILRLLFSFPDFLEVLKQIGAKRGYKYKGMREITLYTPGGGKCKIKSPYFLKAKSKRGKKKNGPNGRGCHLGLEVLGFVNKVAPPLAMKGIAFSLLCPSFEFASKLLEQEGIKLDGKKLSKLCEDFGEEVFENRVRYSLKEGETLRGQRVVITVDGGRSRRRKNKRGRRKSGQKGCGYNSDWIEPKMFVIYVLDEEGNVEKEIEPNVDGAIGVYGFMELLQSYLIELEIQEAEEVILCGDGAPWIWERVSKLLLKLGVLPEKLFEVLDYTHGKQNLYETYNKLSKKQQRKVSLKQWKEWLWEGKIEKIKEDIKRVCNKGGKKALAKVKSYFEKNKHRMFYKESSDRNRPCGSGVVESAIRRVINLRLKSCGTFWKERKIEIMLYLRAQLLYGRWDYLYSNWLKVS